MKKWMVTEYTIPGGYTARQVVVEAKNKSEAITVAMSEFGMLDHEGYGLGAGALRKNRPLGWVR